MSEQESTQQPPSRSGGWTRGIGFAAAGLIIGLLLLQGIDSAKRSGLLSEGHPAPSFTLQRLEGGTVSLGELSGKVVMLDFWATWCPPCRAEMPALLKVAREYEARGVVFVAASRDDEAVWRRATALFVSKVQPSLRPHVAHADDALAYRYKVESLPTLYLIDREGKIADAATGALSESSLRKRLERALSR